MLYLTTFYISLYTHVETLYIIDKRSLSGVSVTVMQTLMAKYLGERPQGTF